MLNLKVLLRKQKTHTVDKRKRIAVSSLIKEGGPWQNAPKHTNKHIEAAIEYALENGWKYIETGKSAHAFCILRCTQGHTEHSMSVYSTPNLKTVQKTS